MRIWITIWIVSGFAVCGNCQSLNLQLTQLPKKLAFFSQNGLNVCNALLINDEWLDTKEPNDPNGSGGIPLLPDNFHEFNSIATSRTAIHKAKIHSRLIPVLLLDLPPPSISV